MNEHDNVMTQVRETFSGLHMDLPVEKVFARSRVRRRRRLSGLVVAAAATAGAAVAIPLSLAGPQPARSPIVPSPAPGSARLAAFSVTSGPGGSTTLIVRKDAQDQLDATALRRALAQRGIPALVTVGTFCRSTAGEANLGQVLHASSGADGSAMVIDGSAMPPGTRLSVGLFPHYTRMLLINDGGRLACSSTSHQPAAHTTAPNTAVRG
jgi:hypothetical protein